jgi:Tfp pilus assembly protein PilX
MSTLMNPTTARCAQRGVSLIFALIALAVISLAAVALVRSVNTGSLVIGNLGFKQDATASTDQAAEQAITWLTANVGGAQLDVDHVDQGYLAANVNLLDPTGNNTSQGNRAVIDWANDNCGSYTSGTYIRCVKPIAGADVNGNKTQYFVNRLCPGIGPANATGNECSAPLGDDGESTSRGDFSYRKSDRFTPTGGGGAYFRIIARAVGGRNAVSYTETIVHF